MVGKLSREDGIVSKHLKADVAPAEAADWTRTDSQMLQVLASTFAEQNKADKAADLLEYVVRRDPQNSEAMAALCGVYFLMQRFEKALDAVQRMEGLEDEIPSSVALVKAQSLWELGREAEASQLLNLYLTDRTDR